MYRHMYRHMYLYRYLYLARTGLERVMSLFMKRAGGRKRKMDTPFPSEPELLALCVGLAMYIMKQRDTQHPMFYSTVAAEVQRAGATNQLWDHNTVRFRY